MKSITCPNPECARIGRVTDFYANMKFTLSALWNGIALLTVIGLLYVLSEMKRGQVATALGLGLVFGIAKIIKANHD